MKRFAVSLCVAAAFAAAPAVGADAPKQNIECAAWASYTGSFAEDEETDQIFSRAFSYFMGGFEASADEPFGPALTAALNAIDEDAGETYDRYNLTCMPIWESFQERIGSWAAAVEAQAAASEAETADEAGDVEAQ